ncbi:sensor histidine kinase [Sulfitobacter aestuarii]|uniref:histidine kinase n=1 Tax=Sulfitobacter aestuarii TaxID=2161676 RepID=A0ABW5U4L9_9RHOB
MTVRQIRDYCSVGIDMFWQRQLVFAAAIGLAAYYYDLWLSLTTMLLISISEIYDYILFRQVRVWNGRGARVARHFMQRIYVGTVLSAAVISFYAIGIALEQGPTTHFMSLFFLFAAALFAAMNNHHILRVLILRLAIYGATFLFIPVWDILRTGAPIESELWMQLFTVIFVLYFIIDCSRIFLRLYRTNVQQLEELKVEHEKTKIAFQAKTEFVSTISHELRTPMTSIKGSLDMTCAGALGELPPNVEKVLKIAQRNSVRLTAIINEILDLQKFEAGRIVLDMQKRDLGTMIMDAIDMNRAYAQTLNVELRAGHLDKDVEIFVDEQRIQQVMANLLSNASKFSHVGAKVVICTEIAPQTVRILVIDEGIGLSEESRTKVFEEFSQVDSSDKRAVGGTGLGMNISRRIVEAMGGSIDYRRNVDVGTTFFVDLPRVPAQAEEQLDADAGGPALHRFLGKLRDKITGALPADTGGKESGQLR